METFEPVFVGAGYHCLECGKDWEEPNIASTTPERQNYLCRDCKAKLGETQEISGDGWYVIFTEYPPYGFVVVSGDCQICHAFPCKHTAPVAFKPKDEEK